MNSGAESRIEIVETDLTAPSHGDHFLKLLDDYTRDLRGPWKGLTEPVKGRLISEIRKRPGVHVVLAYVDGFPAGTVVSVESFSTFTAQPVLNIHDVTVAKEFRARGLSRLMLMHVEKLARRFGCCKLTLEVFERNDVALKLYGSFGFNVDELDPRWGRALFLEKKLN
jgi:GNAT superfamily N-acetyltransferase